ANRLGQIGDGDFRSLRHQDRTLDRVFELADVSRPPVADQKVIDRGRERLDVLLVALAELVQEIVAQEWNVFGALAKRRYTQRNRVDAEIQSLAQPAVAQRGVEIDVGRADE